MRRGLIFSFLAAAGLHAVLLFGFHTTGPVAHPMGNESGPFDVALVGGGDEGNEGSGDEGNEAQPVASEPSPETAPETAAAPEAPAALEATAEPIDAPITAEVVPTPSPTPAAESSLAETPLVRAKPQPLHTPAHSKTAMPDHPKGSPGPAVRKSGTRAGAGNGLAGTAKGTGTGEPGIGVGVQPRFLSHPRPEYPPQARRERQEGVSIVKVRVGPDGRPAEVTLAHSSGFPLLDEAAVRGVKRWTFEPARTAGVPVSSQVEVPVRFNLLP